MNFTAQNALLVNALLFMTGFIIMLFIIFRHKKRLSGLNSFGYYFLLNSIGALLMCYRDIVPYILSIVMANYFVILATMFMITGVSHFYNKKILYKQFLFISIVTIVGIYYFTFIDFNYEIRMVIFGVINFLLHVYLLRMLYINHKEKNERFELLGIIVSMFILTGILRAILLVISPTPETMFEIDSLSSLSVVLLGITGSLIVIGVLSLISNKLIREVKEANNIISNYINNSPVPSMVHAEDGEMLYISEVFTEITGYNIEDISTIDKWINVAYKEKRATVRKIIDDLYEFKDKKNNNIINIYTKDGKIRLWSFHSTYIGKLPDGRNCAMSIAVDITESKEKELEVLSLQEANKKLVEANNDAVDLAKLLVWRMNVEDKTDENQIFVNDKYKEVMGWETSESGMLPDKVFINSIYRDEEGQQSYDEFSILNSKVFSNEIDEYILYDFKHIHSISGKAVYLEHHTKVEERYPDGSVRIIGGYVIDVTETKKVKDALQFEREKAQKYLDIIGTILIALDKEGNITLINKKGCEILEVEENETLGKNWFDNFIPGEINQEIKQVFKDVFTSDSEFPTHYENNVVTSSGKKIAISWYNSVYLDMKGNIAGIISSGEDITEKLKYEENLRQMGYHDALTGLYNRRYYEEKLIELDIEDNFPITIAMGDINGLKLINDAFGHDAGDDLLVSAAKIVSETCRETDLVARIGGDEFVVIMPRTGEEEAEKIIGLIHEKSKSINIESIQLSISFGIKTKVESSEDIQEIYRSAEDLMYREKLLEIPSMRSGAIETILNTLYEKDKNSEIHSRTVSLLSEKIAKAYGMSRQDIAEVKTAGLLHDIGKIIISLEIINKEGKLSASEFTTIKTHSEIGFRILNSTSDMRSISNIVLCHHERWDGGGYPRGISGDDIPVKSRIIAIADAYDAMTSERTYRDIVTNEEALKEIIANAGTQFDPDLAKVFEKHFKDITM
ncbi:MAG: Cyclic di-GMP phosphodiesterase response regulator RpfG [Candidatus Izimaplasma bacterium HR2]|nr:MAG: Cyclic di-GMP phosphodiesterase response regulator RpfG [Candidatus Izimaplasma bacterium HR2]